MLPDSLTITAPLISAPGVAPRASMDQIADASFRAVQLDASMPELRARELDASARRDLAATLRRRELMLAGIDLWIPTDHFMENATIDRAIGVTCETIQLAADLGRCPVSIVLPSGGDERAVEARTAIVDAATRADVLLADHSVAIVDGDVGVGLDPAAHLAGGTDVTQVVSAIGTRLTCARLCDVLATGQRGPLGSNDGRLDVLAYRVALTVAGYQRAMVIDSRQWKDAWAGVLRTAEVWAGLSSF